MSLCSARNWKQRNTEQTFCLSLHSVNYTKQVLKMCGNACGDIWMFLWMALDGSVGSNIMTHANVYSQKLNYADLHLITHAL